MTTSPRYDVCIIGAGLIGLSVGRSLLETYPGLALAVVDKEDVVGFHQSGHNSGVVHSGLYYKPGSLKAKLCVAGRRELVRFVEDARIPYRPSGKLVMATRPSQVNALRELERRGRENGLRALRWLRAEEIGDLEPSAAGIAALHVPEAGVVDYPGLAGAMAERLVQGGAEIALGQQVEEIAQGATNISVRTPEQEFRASVVVNCAGLHSDRVAAMAGVRSEIRIIPFRGEYYTMTPESSGLVRSMVYPVPDPRFPFLGVHFTRKVDDTVEVGPNAVLALGREHYRGVPPQWRDLRESLAFSGLRRLALRHMWTGSAEVLRSRSKFLYARSARSLVPGVRAGDLIRGGAGVRAQAVARDGRLIDDFVIEEAGETIHVLNAPSPGATSSMAIGAHVAGLMKGRFSR